MNRIYITAAIVAMSASQALAGGGLNAENTSTSQSGSQSSLYRGGDSVNAATAIAPSGNNTAPCVIHPSFGVAEGFGLSVGLPYVDHDCNMKGEANMLGAIGNTPPSKGRTLAISHLCTNVPTMSQTLTAQGECNVAKPIPKEAARAVTAQPAGVEYKLCRLNAHGKVEVSAAKGGNLQLAVQQCRQALR